VNHRRPHHHHRDSVTIDLSGFEFGVTFHLGMDWDRLCLPQKFALIVDGQDPHEIMLRVASDTTGSWSVEVLFDSVGQMYLRNGWRWFTDTHDIEVGQIVIFKYDGHGMVTVKAVDETMYRHHYHSNEDD
jgi:hypothetical protein